MSCSRSSRPRSEAQRAASRRNGAKSRGPVSEVGKAISSRNALKHGFDAACSFFLRDADRVDFQALEQRLQACFAPLDEITQRLVRQLARVMWRIEDAERWEADVLSLGCGSDDQRSANQPSSAKSYPIRRFYQVIRIQRQLTERFFALLELLRPTHARYCRNEPELANSCFGSEGYGLFARSLASVNRLGVRRGMRLDCAWGGIWARAGP